MLRLIYRSGFYVSSEKQFLPSLGPIISEDVGRFVSPFLGNPELTLFVIKNNSNNTLDNNMCPNAGDGDHEQGEWLDTAFVPLADRLNTAAPGANLTTKDVYNIMALCPFDSLINDRLSPLCQLFDDDEFGLFEYANDVDKYYGTG